MSRAAAVLLAALLLAACGGSPTANRDRPEKPRGGLTEERHGDLVYAGGGEGPARVTVVRPAAVDGPLPVVLFLHGWGATRPRFYQPWIDHLAREGNAVIYPRYQDSFVDQPSQVLGNALAGVRLALKQIDEDPGSLVVAGHSAGGALAADYAAIARSAKLPQPVAVFSAYPGRTLRQVNVGIPEIDPARIPRDTAVVALAGGNDRVVGQGVARRIARATGGELVVVDDPRASDHLGPQRATAVSRREFWARLDDLIARAREKA